MSHKYLHVGSSIPEIRALACLSPQLAFIYIDYVLKNICCNAGSRLSWDSKTSVPAELPAAAPPSKTLDHILVSTILATSGLTSSNPINVHMKTTEEDKLINDQCCGEYLVLPPCGQRRVIAGDYTDLLHSCREKNGVKRAPQP